MASFDVVRIEPDKRIRKPPTFRNRQQGVKAARQKGGAHNEWIGAHDHKEAHNGKT